MRGLAWPLLTFLSEWSFFSFRSDEGGCFINTIETAVSVFYASICASFSLVFGLVVEIRVGQ